MEKLKQVSRRDGKASEMAGVENDYADDSAKMARATPKGERKNSTQLPDAIQDRRRQGRNFIVSIPKTYGNTDARGVMRAKRHSGASYEDKAFDNLTNGKSR